MRGLFVTATDTGVGKTEVACALVRGHRALGLDVVGMKPAQSGAAPPGLSDAERLAAAAGGVEPAAAICPYTLRAPLAPPAAARLEGARVELGRILEVARALAARHAALVVEGAGGLLSPIAEGATCADLALALALPVLVVARAGLGTVNHTALTVEALRARGLRVHGVVLSQGSPEVDPSAAGNPALVERTARVRVLASLPHEADITLRERRFAAELARAVQFPDPAP